MAEVKKANVNVVAGSDGTTQHSFSNEEKAAFVDWVNSCLHKDIDLQDRLPMKMEGTALFEAVKDGILLCKLINDAVPETIDVRVLNVPRKKKLNIHLIGENQNLCINSAKAIGCNVVNIGPSDLIEGRPHLVMGLIWQIIRIGLLSKINLTHHPELYRLLEPGETIQDLLKLGPEAILLRWVNYHLKEAGSSRRCNNFSGDIKDSEIYTILLKQIAPKNAGVDTKALSESNHTKRAEMVLENADKIDCRKFLHPNNIVQGHPKLNLAFVANLFNNYPALEPVQEIEVIPQETREEKTFRNWMNSLGVEPFVGNLYEDLKDGLVLLQLEDKVNPGVVNWKKVNQPPFRAMGAQMKKMENCNYAVDIGKNDLKFSLVGIAGSNVANGDKTPILSVVWQLMRAHVLSILNALSKGGARIGDNEVIEWANQKLSSGGKQSNLKSFKDPAIASSQPIADLIDCIKPDTLDFNLMSSGSSEEDMLMNAKLVVSTARKIGAVVFCLPEDVVEVKPKMMMTLFAGLMAVDMGVSQ